MNIHCPNCQENIDKDVFSQANEPREYYCSNCDTSFSLSLIDLGEQSKNNIIVGSEFDLIIENGENYTWKNVDENLEPILSCVACANKLGGNLKGDNNQLKKCRSCELLLNIVIS